MGLRFIPRVETRGYDVGWTVPAGTYSLTSQPMKDLLLSLLKKCTPWGALRALNDF